MCCFSSTNVPSLTHQKRVLIFKGITSGSRALISIMLPNIFGTLPSKLPSESASNSFRCLHWQQNFILWEFSILKADLKPNLLNKMEDNVTSNQK